MAIQKTRWGAGRLKPSPHHGVQVGMTDRAAGQLTAGSQAFRAHLLMPVLDLTDEDCDCHSGEWRAQHHQLLSNPPLESNCVGTESCTSAPGSNHFTIDLTLESMPPRESAADDPLCPGGGQGEGRPSIDGHVCTQDCRGATPNSDWLLSSQDSAPEPVLRNTNVPLFQPLPCHLQATGAAAAVGCGKRKRQLEADVAAKARAPPGKIHQRVREGLLGALMERMRFRGTVSRLGRTRGGRRSWQKPTVLLTDVKACSGAKLNGELQYHTDHVWLKVGKQLSEIGLRAGRVVEFDARVRWYRKRGGWDLQLSHHTRISLLPQKGPHG